MKKYLEQKNKKLRKSNKINDGIGYNVFSAFNILFLILFSFICFYPYLTVVVLAFNDGLDAMRGGLGFFPRVPTLDNFKTIFGDERTLNAAWVSVQLTVIGTVIGVVVEYFAAYALRRKQLVGKKVIVGFYMIPMFINGGLIPTYLLMSQLGLVNNFWIYVLPGAFSFFNMVIIRTYLYTIPESIEEAAKIDGANDIYIMLKIFIPLSKPILATIALYHAVALWNNWITCLIYINKQNLYNLQFLLWQYIKESETIANLLRQVALSGGDISVIMTSVTPDTVKAAQIVLTTVPILLVYPFLQKYFIKGVLIGGVKE